MICFVLRNHDDDTVNVVTPLVYTLYQICFVIDRFCLDFDCKLVIDAYEYKRFIGYSLGERVALS